MEMSNFKLKRVSLKSLIKDKKIYPIKFNFKNYQDITSLEKNKKDTKNINNFKTPPGIKIYQLLSTKQYEKLVNVMEEIIDDNFEETNEKNTIYSIRHCQTYKKVKKSKNYKIMCLDNLRGMDNFFNGIKISEINRKYMESIFIKLCKLYINEKYTCEDLLQETSYALFKYNGKHNGLKLHTDNIIQFQGPIFIFNLGKSIIDFVPFSEIYEEKNQYKPVRIILDPGVVYVTDGDSRFNYTHGIPSDISNEKTVRYAIVIRFPVHYKNKKMCQLNDFLKKNVGTEDYEGRKKWYKKWIQNPEINNLYPCYSDTFQNSD